MCYILPVPSTEKQCGTQYSSSLKNTSACVGLGLTAFLSLFMNCTPRRLLTTERGQEVNVGSLLKPKIEFISHQTLHNS